MKLEKPLKLDFEVKEPHLAAGELSSDSGDRANATLLSDALSEDMSNARTSWAIGNWQELVMLDNASLPEKGDRQYLAILAATGHQYSGDEVAEDRCIQLALKWGATKEQAKTMLLSGIYNRLGRASVLAEDYDKAVEYFRKSLNTNFFSGSLEAEYLKRRIETQLADMSKEDLENTLKNI